MYGVLRILSIAFVVMTCSGAKYLSVCVFWQQIGPNCGSASNLPRCRHGDTDCIAKSVDYFVREFSGGLRDIHLINIDPLVLNEVDIIQDQKGPVTLNLNFKDVLFYGLSKMKTRRVVGFDKDPSTSKFEIYGYVDRLSLIGQYKAKGKILIIPVVGTGAANLTIDNAEFNMKLTPKIETKKGKQYVTFTDVKLHFDTTRVWMYFDNLFNGNKELGESTNIFINENWFDIFTELRPVLNKAVGEICRGIINPIFARFPYDQMFL